MGIDTSVPTVTLDGGRYGVATLKDAFAALADYCDRLNLVVLTGGSKTILDFVKSYVKAKGIDKNVYVVEEVTDMWKIYDITDVLVTAPTIVTIYEACVKNIPCVLIKPINVHDAENAEYIAAGKLAQRGVKDEQLVTAVLGFLNNNMLKQEYLYNQLKAIIKLKDGSQMTAELYEDVAPISVRNFVKLAKSGFYDGLIFHRVIPGFMIQGGGMDENLRQKNADCIKGEFAANGVNNPVKHTLGVLSMARAMNPDSGSSQFFVCVEDCPHLDGAYAAFGKLCDKASEDVAVAISKVRTTRRGWFDDVPVDPVVIDTIEIED